MERLPVYLFRLTWVILDLVGKARLAQNIGLEMSLFNNRLTATIDGYFNRSKKLLLNQAIPSSSGVLFTVPEYWRYQEYRC